MDEDEKTVSDDEWDSIPVKPDRRGPKTIAILLFFGGLLILFQAYTDYQSHNLADISDAEVDRLLETPNSQSDNPITTSSISNSMMMLETRGLISLGQLD